MITATAPARRLRSGPSAQAAGPAAEAAAIPIAAASAAATESIHDPFSHPEVNQ